MSETFRTAWLSDIVDILDDSKTKSIICHGKQFDLVKHGRWIINRRGNIECSLCGNEPYHDNKKNMNYCPKCGAKMDEVRDD